MKKFFLLAVLSFIATLAKSQSSDFHAFKFDIGLGYAEPANGSGDGTKAGLTFTLQPHVRLSDNFAIGIRMEAAVIGNYASSSGNVNATAVASGCLSGEYYLSNHGFRPFIGVGAGIFDQESAAGNTNGGTVVQGPRTMDFGGYPVLGFEAGHFRMSVEYDLAGKGNDYAAAKIGFFFGGGRKKHKTT
jgi:hypothetical protein